MSRYAKGARAEHRSRRLLESQGYHVIRAAGSHGEFDLIGVSSTGIILVQVKSNAWPGTVEMDALRAFPRPPGCRRIVHRWRDRVPVPDVREVFPAESPS